MLSSKVSALAAYMMMSVKDVEVILAYTRGVIDAAKGFFELIIMSTARQVGEAPEECASCLRSLLARYNSCRNTPALRQGGGSAM